jgi:very-short-patch-repair endonuclease
MAHADRLRGRKGVAKARAVAALWSPERESLLEDQLFADVVSVVGSGVVRQLEVPGRAGSVQARLDVAVPELRLAFEADGLHFHSTDAQIAADQQRDRLLLALGWLVVRFREGALDNTLGVRREISAVVERRRRDLRAA